MPGYLQSSTPSIKTFYPPLTSSQNVIRDAIITEKGKAVVCKRLSVADI